MLFPAGQHILLVGLASMGAGRLAGAVQQPVLPLSCLQTVEPAGQQYPLPSCASMVQSWSQHWLSPLQNHVLGPPPPARAGQQIDVLLRMLSCFTGFLSGGVQQPIMPVTESGQTSVVPAGQQYCFPFVPVIQLEQQPHSWFSDWQYV